ncbi:MAG: cobalamin-independent methionine synthase II family protein [Burkholderiales bacterium]|nr:cobalamin-independent methionine synthase II family protein [Burkholderiales bacterium]
MQRSGDRILTTHTGSLPRPDDLLALLKAKESGGGFDAAVFSERVRAEVAAVVRRQIEAGLSVVNDGEQGKIDYSTYIKERLTGFEGEAVPMGPSREAREFPGFWAERGQGAGAPWIRRPACTGPIQWKDFAAVERDIANLAAAKRASAGAAAEYFLTAVSPGQAARFLGNRYYPSHETYLRALGRALKREYDAIAAAGFVLQVDCPDLGSGWNNMFAEAGRQEFLQAVELHLEVLDEATREVPAEQLRLHLCWGNYNGPHTQDIPLADIIGPVLASRASAISFEGANPRHEHEWRIWNKLRLPAGKILIPGVIDSTTNFVEHPVLVADRIRRYVECVGRENVIAGVDCGFGTFAGGAGVHPEVAWAKLRALAQGARLAG